MCRGVENENKGNLVIKTKAAAATSILGSYSSSISCELCSSRATLYCLADDAFLCERCDKWVHGANFLALRHIRCLLCDTCQRMTHRYRVGSSTQVVLPTVLSWRGPERGRSEECNEEEEEGDLGDEDHREAPSTVRRQPFMFL